MTAHGLTLGCPTGCSVSGTPRSSIGRAVGGRQSIHDSNERSVTTPRRRLAAVMRMIANGRQLPAHRQRDRALGRPKTSTQIAAHGSRSLATPWGDGHIGRQWGGFGLPSSHGRPSAGNKYPRSKRGPLTAEEPTICKMTSD